MAEISRAGKRRHGHRDAKVPGAAAGGGRQHRHQRRHRSVVSGSSNFTSGCCLVLQ